MGVIAVVVADVGCAWGVLVGGGCLWMWCACGGCGLWVGVLVDVVCLWVLVGVVVSVV